MKNFENSPVYKKAMMKALAEVLYPSGCIVCGRDWDEHIFYVYKPFRCPEVIGKQFRGLEPFLEDDEL